jgi:GGDEF domain-containing protein
LNELLPDSSKTDEVLSKIGMSIGFAQMQKDDDLNKIYQKADDKLSEIKKEKGTVRNGNEK